MASKESAVANAIRQAEKDKETGDVNLPYGNAWDKWLEDTDKVEAANAAYTRARTSGK
jgi:hypothetical protein